MRMKIRNRWYRLRGSFWFMPALTAAAAVALSVATIAADRVLLDGEAQPGLIYSGGPEGARMVLSVIAGAMMTVAGVVFSITIVVLSLASSQFGPRLIRNFMEVKANQIVLGSFVATYIYSIIVLHAIKGVEGASFVPRLSVSVALVLSLLCLGLLIYFIHEVSESIQAGNIIARVRHDLEGAVDRIFPEMIGKGEAPPPETAAREYDIPTGCDREACQVPAARSGYLQALDGEALMRIAVEEDLLIHLGHRPGHFITGRDVLVTVWPGKKVDEALSARLNAIFIVGAERTLDQDIEFAVSQLAEIAVRALSPGINDPITAITCIDWLGVTLGQLADRRMPASHRYDERNRLRIISNPLSFEGVVDTAFNMIRQNSLAVPAVAIRLLETMATVARQPVRDQDRRALRRQADLVVRGCREAFSATDDLRDLEERYRAAVKALDGEPDAMAVLTES